MPPHKTKRTGDGKRRGNAPPSPPDKLDLYGLHTVEAALRNPARKCHALQVTLNARNRLGDAIDETRLTVTETTPRELDRIFGKDAVHQGCRLTCAPLPDHDLKGLLRGGMDGLRLLVLDQVTDPHNVGAILRSAAAFAVDAIVTTMRHAPVESAVLAKAASGALEHVPFVRVTNLGNAIDEMTSAGIMVIGLDSEGETELESLTGKPPYALVLGAEGKGLRQRTRSLCSALARIDMPGAIASLNVSNAAALSLYAARRGEKR